MCVFRPRKYMYTWVDSKQLLYYGCQILAPTFENFYTAYLLIFERVARIYLSQIAPLIASSRIRDTYIVEPHIEEGLPSAPVLPVKFAKSKNDHE